jgi:multidrug efflux pump subunit AcrA (membrane-fusion protein)
MLSAVMAGGAIAAGCKPPQGQAKMQRPPATVVVSTAVAENVPVYITEIGKTVAVNSVMIQPQVGGKITEVHFTDGSNVTKGQLLFTIDPRPFQAALASAEANLAESQAKLTFAKQDYQRVLDVKETGAVSAQDIETKKNAVAVAQAQVAAGQAAIDTARLNLEYCQIRSPIDGRAGARLVDPGNVVLTGGPNGGTNLLRIETFDPIYVDFTVTEDELGTVRKYMAMGRLPQQDPQGRLTVMVDVPADSQNVIQALGGAPSGNAANAQATTAPAKATNGPAQGANETAQPANGLASATTAPALANASEEIAKEKRELSPAATQPAPHPHQGVLTFLDNAVQEGTGTVRVRATVPNSDHYFWPGQLVHAKLVLTVKKDAVLVPKTAQQIGQQGPYVYVIEQEGTTKNPKGEQVPAFVARLRQVQVGQDQGDMVVITDGLKAGERVVTEGQMGVTPDGAVNPIETPKTQMARAGQ